MNDKKKILILLSIFLVFPSLALAGNYTTIDPSGEVTSPITQTFQIPGFSQGDYPFGACNDSFVPASIKYLYYADSLGTSYGYISPTVIPTSEEISSGTYTDQLNLVVGLEVYSIGAEFYTNPDGTGLMCGFYGNQPGGIPLPTWSAPIFTVIAPEPTIIHVPGGAAPVFQNAAPLVDFIGLPQESIWSGKKTISYSASDPNNPPYGLKQFPINFYLSNDGGTIWKELAKDEPNSEKYIFDTNNFPDGKNYKLKIIVIDNADAKGEVISRLFAIDNTPPTFEVALSFAGDSIKEKDKINLKITSSEDLKQAPEVQIIQAGAEAQPLLVDGFGKNFSASYTALKGYLGAATILIKGKDLVGNTGEKITSGETFLVSRLGPSPPTIKNMVDNEVVSDPKIDIQGNAPSAKEVTFIFNKKEKFIIKPGDNGDFAFKDIILSSSNYGYNTLTFSSLGKDGIQSDERIITVKLNSPPEISRISGPNGEISGITRLEWKAFDLNNDKLVYALFYSIDGGKNWDSFSKGLLKNWYELNTAELFDSDNYRLRVVVDDGTAKSEIVSEKFAIKNDILFYINIPANYLLDVAAPAFKGNVRISENKIVSLRYSLGREEWLSAEAADGKFNSSFEEFLIKFSAPLIDGKHILFIEARDEKENIFRTFKPFIIDTVPPIPPKIISPLPAEVIDSSRDTDSKLGGIQINVSGKAEAGADLEFIVNNRRYTTAANGQGEFNFENATFLTRGINRYFLSSTDATGNVSKIEGFAVSDNPPKISVLTPQRGDFIGGTREIKWRAFDEDGDKLTFQVLCRLKNKKWISLAQNLTIDTFKFDALNFSGGEYELEVIASDGLADASANIEKLFIDNILPKINLDLTGPLSVGRIKLFFSGSATDDLSGVQFIEYSIDAQNWFKAAITKGYLEKNAFFVIRHPFELEDGEYNFGVRAIDAVGNISKTIFEKIIVDTTPPRIGSYTVSRDSLIFLPKGENFEIVAGSKIKFTISLEADTKEAFLTISDKKIDLSKNKATSLWEAEIGFDASGSSVLITASDALGNITNDKELGSFKVIPKGKIFFADENGAIKSIEGAKINILVWSEDSQSFIRWQSENYGEENPATTFENGEYEMALPAGKYQLLVQKTGFMRVRTSNFVLNEPGFINFDFTLTKRGKMRGFFEDILEKLKI
ncbi:MAG: carboxypeptidase regulatory-like domain-containing protein [Candidatus Portnoybacteria bacterium]|nr:carboxypeptidase regulatory-like domain-containing protein [Candidatus Portnoybacteria bacterium]